jgi:hypothetical protein
MERMAVSIIDSSEGGNQGLANDLATKDPRGSYVLAVPSKKIMFDLL